MRRVLYCEPPKWALCGTIATWEQAHRMAKKVELRIAPLSEANWSDFETLFGRSGAYGGCWCMWWRLTRGEFERCKGEKNRRALRALVRSGRAPGLLGYADGEAVGWCSIAPREEFPVLARSPVLKPIDDAPAWSIVCFYIRRDWRSRGVGRQLLEAAIAYARSKGATLVEGYPVAPRKQRMPDYLAYVGVPSMFEKAGFRECARRSAGRPIMRRRLRPKRRGARA
jgi:GNAT superfamily N-acetyltransferase